MKTSFTLLSRNICGGYLEYMGFLLIFRGGVQNEWVASRAKDLGGSSMLIYSPRFDMVTA